MSSSLYYRLHSGPSEYDPLWRTVLRYLVPLCSFVFPAFPEISCLFFPFSTLLRSIRNLDLFSLSHICEDYKCMLGILRIHRRMHAQSITCLTEEGEPCVQRWTVDLFVCLCFRFSNSFFFWFRGEFYL